MRRTRQPYRARPGADAKAKILAAVGGLLGALEESDFDRWLDGYCITARQVAAFPGMRLSRATVRQYLAALARSGDLTRTCRGEYALPITPAPGRA